MSRLIRSAYVARSFVVNYRVSVTVATVPLCPTLIFFGFDLWAATISIITNCIQIIFFLSFWSWCFWALTQRWLIMRSIRHANIIQNTLSCFRHITSFLIYYLKIVYFRFYFAHFLCWKNTGSFSNIFYWVRFSLRAIHFLSNCKFI